MKNTDLGLKYDKRIIKQFSNFLKNNGIKHTFYMKNLNLIIDDGFKTIYTVHDIGYWKITRIDKQVDMTQYEFCVHIRSLADLIGKSIRYRMIPYGTAKKFKV